MAPASPAVAQWELTIRLRQRRKQLGMDIGGVAKELGFTRNYWSVIENGRNLLTEQKLQAAAELFEMDQEETKDLLSLRGMAKQRGWWQDYSGMFNDELMRLHGLEHGADSIRSYSSLLIPALLQCSDYARALMHSPFGVCSPVEAEQRVDARLRRQERLYGPDPLHLTAMFSEAALQQETWGTSVRRAQLEHLIALIEEKADTVDIRVLPFDSHASMAMGGASIYLIDFASPRLPAVAWSENAAFGAISEDATEIRNLNFLWNSVSAAAPSKEDSLILIKEKLRQLT